MNNLEPQTWSDLIVNSCLEVIAVALTKLEVLGVKVQVNEVEKLDFHVHVKK